jgi:hypothetical protein
LTIRVGKKTKAHHEAGHAVVARALGIKVTHATLSDIDGEAVVSSWSAGHAAAENAANAPYRIAGLEKDAMVALAGPLAEFQYRPLSRGAVLRTWKSGWASDRRNAVGHTVLGGLILGFGP